MLDARRVVELVGRREEELSVTWNCLHCYDRGYIRKVYSDGSVDDSADTPCPLCRHDEYVMWQRKRSKELLATCCVIAIGIVITIVIANLMSLGLKEMTRP